MNNDDIKHLIWSNRYEVVEKEAAYFMEEEGLSEDEAVEAAYASIENSLYDERANLKSIQSGGPILVVASLGLWNGRVSGYKELPEGTLDQILYDGSCDEGTWYSNGKDICFEGFHHDGRNHYTYRIVNFDNIDSDEAEDAYNRLLDDIYSQRPYKEEDYMRFTLSMHPLIAGLYGWPVDAE